MRIRSINNKGTDRKWFVMHNFCKIDTLAILIGITICFLTMYYADITVTARFSLTFLDSLIDGKFISFYENALATGIAPEGAVYDIGIYIVFAIWGLPIWILQKVFGLNPLSIGSLLWFKLLLGIIMLWSSFVLKKIAGMIGLNEKTQEYIGMVYLLSFNLLFPVMVAVQYDIVPLLFIMYGIYYYINKKNKKFIFLFAIAMTMKPFALLPFIALVLLKEKKIRNIVWQCLCGISFMGLCKFLYSFSAAYRESCGSFLTKMLPLLFKVSIPIGNTEMSLFIFGLLLVYIAAFSWKLKDLEMVNKRFAVFVVSCVWIAFCLFTDLTPYWSVYLSPFLVLAVFMANDKVNLTLIMDLILNLSLTFVFIFKFTWVYGGGKTFQYLLLKPVYNKYIGTNEGVTVAGILRHLSLENMLPAFGAALLVAAIIILYYAYKGIYGKENNKDIVIDIWHIRIRIGMLYGWVAVCAAAFCLSILGY